MRHNTFEPSKFGYAKLKMHPSTLINVTLLCFLNASFMIAGTVLNSVVIISLWKSSQLRKKLCYFMILVLSSFDLALVIIVQPLLILSTILWSKKIYHAEIERMRIYTSALLEGFSTFALLTLNIERCLALSRPFFHQTAVTKGKLLFFQALQVIIVISLMLLSFLVDGLIIATVYLLSFLFALAVLNYKMLTIAKSKREDELRVAPDRPATPDNRGRHKKRMRNLKSVSTCTLVVGCFFICSIPKSIFGTWSYTSKTPINDRQWILFYIWASTFICMNSTFNCLIFFWRNSILRCEGMKILKCSET